MADGTGGLKSKDRGFSAYMYTTQSGAVRLMVPELNFFHVVMQQLGGHGKRFFNISVGEPPSELFVPPPGVDVRQSDRPFTLRSKPDAVPGPLDPKPVERAQQ
jgi:hypothetical protein